MRSSRASSISTSISNVRPSSSELNIGDTILIIDIKDVQADFLEKQYAGAIGIKTEDAIGDDFPTTKKVYYVHYNNMDRRLDEWVDTSRIVDSFHQAPLTPGESIIKTRAQRRIQEEFKHAPREFEEMDPTTAQFEKEHEERTKVKNIDVIYFGRFEINAWYFSPFPESFSSTRRLYFCEFCMVYTPDLELYRHHMLHQCKRRQPPGTEIYRDDNLKLAIFEVDGKANKTYCQCLCLLAKLFLDHKTLYFDVDLFLFYILCEVDERGAHTVGFFSKERGSTNNLACIMVLPPFQRKGYGKLLIQLSYWLSHREGRIGTPEKPLSDLGKVSYRSFWWWLLLGKLDEIPTENIMTVNDLSRITGIHPDDIQSTFTPMGLCKFWRGEYVVNTNPQIIQYFKSQTKLYKEPRIILDPDLLRWKPKKEIFVPTSSQFSENL
uniref:Histone acetyltransferase n=1 Tax=Acrobeloides nanus TaxID=290746 RepID=A0A914DEJ9_9BILA